MTGSRNRALRRIRRPGSPVQSGRHSAVAARGVTVPSADHAALVLNELQRRLTLIRQLQQLIRDNRADEVHQLQPLFERGLWIFGPEYEAVDLESGLEVNKIGEKNETVIMPMLYDVVLNRAHARTFNLQRRVEALGASARTDPE